MARALLHPDPGQLVLRRLAVSDEARAGNHLPRHSFRTPFIVGAYAAAPAVPRQRNEFYRLLGEEPWIDGLEIPYPGDLETGLEESARRLAPGWTASTITAIPGTMYRLQLNPHFGLASPDAGGRAEAMEFMARIRSTVVRLAERRGCAAVRYVQLHSAPRRTGRPDILADSLAQLVGWDWAGAEVVIEHCDRHIAGRVPEKGFLPIEDEIEIADRLGLGVHVNWGRSCLEGRDPSTPRRDILAARARGVLRGVVFSGTSATDSVYGPAWADAHLPAASDEPSSQMGLREIEECTRAALDTHLPGRPAAYLGAKICTPPQAAPLERVRMLRTIAEVVRSAAVG